MNRRERSERIAVIGSGLMGHGIAQVFARGGCRVAIHDIDEDRLSHAKQRIELNLKVLSDGGLAGEEPIDNILSKITPTTDLVAAVRAADVIVESITENLQLKRELFKEIDSRAPKAAILASNTSKFTITDIGRDVQHKERLVITHWFNPPYLIPVVEVVKGIFTSQDTVEKTVTLLESMGKLPVRVLKEVPGHLLNRIQFALFRETLGLLQDGVATPEEIDKAVSGSLGLRLATIGPLKSIDLAGIDLFWYGMRDIYKYLDNASEPQQIIQEKVKAGEVGIKSGKGFFEYPGGGLMNVEERDRDHKIMKLLKILYPAQGDENG